MLGIIGVIFILALAFVIRRAARGSVFERSCGCTPNIARLKNLEDAKSGTDNSARSES